MSRKQPMLPSVETSATAAADAAAEHTRRAPALSTMEDDYKLKAKVILAAFEGVLSGPEIRNVLSMRLREALDTFIASGGSAEAWSKLYGLMCAFQSLPYAKNGGAP